MGFAIPDAATLGFQAAIDALDGPYFQLDRNGAYTAFNSPYAAAMQAHGAAVELGQSVLDYCGDPETRAACQENLQRALAGETFAIEWRCHRILHRPLRDREGNVAGVSVYTHDLTEQRRAEEALRASETRYQNLFDQITEGFALHEIVCDRNGEPCDYRFLEINPAFEQLTGLRRAEVVGKTMREVLPNEDPKWIRTYAEVALTGKPIRLENYAPTLERYYDVLSYRPAPLQFAVLFTDITERKRVEEALRESETSWRSLLEVAPDGVLVHQDGKIVFANAAAVELYAAGTAENLVGRRIMDLVHPEQHALAASRIRRAIHGGRMAPCAFRHVRVDGVVIEVETMGAPAEWQGRRAVQVMVRDVTERRRLEAVREAQQARQAVLARVSQQMLAAPTVDALLDQVSQAARELTGAGTASTLYGAQADQPVPPAGLASRLFDATGRPNGMILVSGRREGEFGAEHESALHQLAAMASLALQQMEARQEAVNQKNRLEAVLESLPAGMAMYDLHGGVIRSNAEYERIWAGPPPARGLDDYPQYKAWWPETGRPVQPGEWASAAAIREGRTISDQLLEIEAFDGARRFVLNSGAPVRDASGAVAGAVVAIQDITELKRMETALRESEDKFRTLADSIPQLAWIADASGTLRWCNRRWREYTGVCPEEAGARIWRTVHHPDHYRRVAAKWKRHLESGEDWEDDFPLRGKDGGYRWFLSRATPIRDSQGRLVRWFGTNTDITERLEAERLLEASEAQFRRLYEANIVGIVCADEERVYESNDLCLEMLGYTRQELEEGRLRWPELTAPECRHLDERGLQELRTKGACAPFEKECFRKDGSRFPVLIGATLLEPSPLRYLCFVLDLSERKRLERRILEAQKLETAGLLAGGVAHDFNNLLVGVIGNASLASDLLPQNHPAQESLRRIIKTGEQAAHLTRQMLAYSGKGRFVIELVDLSALVPEVVEVAQPSISKRIALHQDLAPGLPRVEADRGQIQQVLLNLLINAAEAIGEAPGLISVRTGAAAPADVDRADLAPGEYVFIEVRDTGCGMDSATRTRIFDPFFSTKFTGRGLGLAAVAGILRGHKGGVTVESAPGKGSRFTALFPAAAEQAAVAAPVLRPASPPICGHATILVVDDEAVVRETVERALERHGYTVLVARDAATAIALVAADPGRISLVLLDLSMPGMSAEEALPALRRIRPTLRVLLSSGYSEHEAMRRFAGCDVCGFLQKPYTSAALVERIEQALG